MTSITLSVTGAKVDAAVTGPLTSGMVGIPVTIEYDEAWDGLIKNLICRSEPKSCSIVNTTRVVVDIGTTATVAHEVMRAGRILYLGIEGHGPEGELVMPTAWVRCGEILPGATADADPSADPTLPIWAELQAKLTRLEQQTVTKDQFGSVLAACFAENPNVINAGLTPAQTGALNDMFRAGAFVSDDISAAYAAFRTAFNISGSDIEEEPDEPVAPEITLLGITVTYSGGDVAVGTAVTDLEGIVVTAAYSDGSSAAVTGYTLSGEIAEGENTVTVTYQGRTAAFTVTGVAESGGEDVENNGWVSGEAYAIAWKDGCSLNASGAEAAEEGFSVTDFLPCLNVSRMATGNLYKNERLWYYDADRNFLRQTPTSYVVDGNNVETYRDAYYVRTYKRTATTNAGITPYRDDLLDENTPWESGRFYRVGWLDNMWADSATGVVKPSTSGYHTSELALCYGANALQFSNGSRIWITWYDADRQFISQMTRQNVTTAVTIPDNAHYFRFSTNIAGANFWVQLS